MRQFPDLAFNAAVLHIAGKLWPIGFDISENAPSTLDALVSQFEATRRLTVSSLHSDPDQTIYGDREVNYAFRAWHDWHHLKLRAPFTIEGEKRVARGQIADLYELYGQDYVLKRSWARIVWAEVVGQAWHSEKWGDFPRDQRGFMHVCLEHGIDAAIEETW